MLLSLLNKRFFTLRVGSLIKVIELKWFIYENFSHVIGMHGLKRIQCYSIVAIVNANDNRLITAYPCL